MGVPHIEKIKNLFLRIFFKNLFIKPRFCLRIYLFSVKTAKQTNERLAFDQLNSRLTLKLKVLDTVKNVPPCNKMLAVCDVTCDVTAPVL